MSTVCKLIIKASEADALEAIQSYLTKEGTEHHLTDTEWPTATERDNFSIYSSEPNIFSVKEIDKDLSEIHFNAFSNLESLQKSITRTLKTCAVLNIYQSAASAGSWSYSLDGSLLREIEFSEGDIIKESGTPLEFETFPLGTDISDEDEDEFYIYGTDDMDSYNEAVSIDALVYQEYDKGWHNIKLLESSTIEAVESQLKTANKTPWWKFW